MSGMIDSYEEKVFRMVVYRLEGDEYAVLSKDSSFGVLRQYTVKRNCYKFLCTCPDYQKHSDDVHYVCKHIEAVFKSSITRSWGRDANEVKVVRWYRGPVSEGFRRLFDMSDVEEIELDEMEKENIT